jgi:Flp pilus assembly protein TadG
MTFTASSFRRFRRDENGSAAMMLGLALIPLCLIGGAALDYARGAREKAALDSALDSTALAAAQDARRFTEAELRTRAQSYFAAAYAAHGGSGAPTVTLNVDAGAKRLSVSAANALPTTLMKIGGIDEMRIRSATTVSYGSPNIEVALVLDNTGSMGWDNKMDALQVAASNFINQLAAKARAPGEIKVSVVPFTVRTETANAAAPWLSFDAVAPATWTGCIADRAKPADVTAAPGALYPAVACPGRESNLARMIGLSDVSDATRRAALLDRIASLRPTGNTNITIGLSWGMTSLTPGSQLPGAAAMASDVRKFVVLLTDGDNTWNGFGDPTPEIDARTRLACASIKANSNVTLYTIRVIAGNAALLRACASSPDKYYEAADAAGIQPAFQAILNSILSIRITS